MHARLVFLLYASLLFATEALAQPGPDTSQWPDGRPGADFNITDADGLKQGRWIRVYPNGKLYYSGSFRDGRPVGAGYEGRCAVVAHRPRMVAHGRHRHEISTNQRQLVRVNGRAGR